MAETDLGLADLRYAFWGGPSNERGLLQGWINNNFTADDLVFKDPATGDLVDSDGVSMDTSLAVRKTADETVNASATLQDDDELTRALAANETRVGKFVLYVTAGSDTPDMDVALTVPAGADIVYNVIAPRTSDNILTHAGTATSSGTEIRAGVLSTGGMVVIEYSVANGATAGDLQLQWAQGGSTAVDTTVKAGSYEVSTKV